MPGIHEVHCDDELNPVEELHFPLGHGFAVHAATELLPVLGLNEPAGQ